MNEISLYDTSILDIGIQWNSKLSNNVVVETKKKLFGLINIGTEYKTVDDGTYDCDLFAIVIDKLGKSNLVGYKHKNWYNIVYLENDNRYGGYYGDSEKIHINVAELSEYANKIYLGIDIFNNKTFGNLGKVNIKVKTDIIKDSDTLYFDKGNRYSTILFGEIHKDDIGWCFIKYKDTLMDNGVANMIKKIHKFDKRNNGYEEN